MLALARRKNPLQSMCRQTEMAAVDPWHRSERALSQQRLDVKGVDHPKLDAAVVARLDQGLAELSLDLPAGARERLLTYLEQLIRWNKSYNLTAVRDPLDMVNLHLLDALSVLPALTRLRATQSATHMVDVGAGAGLLGIALAITSPGLALTLVESSGKKAAFMRQTGIELGLQRFDVCQSRVEKLTRTSLAQGPVDVLICRAFRSLSEFLELTGHLINERTIIVAMKGPAADDELRELDAALAADGALASLAPLVRSRRISVETLTVPGLDATRKLIVLEPRADASVHQPTIQE